MAARIFAILAAALLVTAVGVATLAPYGLSLGYGLLMLDRGTVPWLRTNVTGFAWDWLAWPLLQRPLWLVPASLGLICAGIAMTFNLGKPSTQRRRRS